VLIGEAGVEEEAVAGGDYAKGTLAVPGIVLRRQIVMDDVVAGDKLGHQVLMVKIHAGIDNGDRDPTAGGRRPGARRSDQRQTHCLENPGSLTTGLALAPVVKVIVSTSTTANHHVGWCRAFPPPVGRPRLVTTRKASRVSPLSAPPSPFRPGQRRRRTVTTLP
jgi:hypothetical protein